MHTQCNKRDVKIHPLGNREVRAAFDAGAITGDAAALPLREAEKQNLTFLTLILGIAWLLLIGF